MKSFVVWSVVSALTMVGFNHADQALAQQPAAPGRVKPSPKPKPLPKAMPSATAPAQKISDPTAPKTDLDRLQGKWKAVSLSNRGNDADPEGFYLEFFEKQVMVGEKGKPNPKGHFDLQVLDYTTPKGINILIAKTSTVWPAIYDFRGDELYLCINMHGSSGIDRPYAFETNNERIANRPPVNDRLYILRRVVK